MYALNVRIRFSDRSPPAPTNHIYLHNSLILRNTQFKLKSLKVTVLTKRLIARSQVGGRPRGCNILRTRKDSFAILLSLYVVVRPSRHNRIDFVLVVGLNHSLTYTHS